MKGKFLLHLFAIVFVIYTIYMSLSRDSLVPILSVLIGTGMLVGWDMLYYFVLKDHKEENNNE